MGRIPLRLGPDESQTCTGILVEYLLKPASHLLCSLERTWGFRLLRLTAYKVHIGGVGRLVPQQVQVVLCPVGSF